MKQSQPSTCKGKRNDVRDPPKLLGPSQAEGPGHTEQRPSPRDISGVSDCPAPVPEASGQSQLRGPGRPPGTRSGDGFAGSSGLLAAQRSPASPRASSGDSVSRGASPRSRWKARPSSGRPVPGPVALRSRHPAQTVGLGCSRAGAQTPLAHAARAAAFRSICPRAARPAVRKL